jgi:GNAT superfamily N-acetyltransferase
VSLPDEVVFDSGKISIRHARSADGLAILRAYEWLFEPPGWRPPDWPSLGAKRALVAAIESPGSAVLLAEAADGAIVGLCTAYLDLDSVRFGRRCWVEDLAVAPDHRSRGIGARLLAEAREWAAGHHATHLELDTGIARTDAQRFYERESPDARSLCYAWRVERGRRR